MMSNRISPTRIVARAMLLAAAISVAACGGGAGTPTPAAVDQLVSTTVAGYPHQVDVYQTAGATRAIVLLHGGGGNKSAVAYQVGLNTDATSTTFNTINWAWLDANKVLLVVPQGQHIASEPNATTWHNYAMNSGQDDKAFLQALAAKIRGEYGIANISLMGHSMGGVMTNRMWCESASSFNAYVSLAGPASSEFNQAATPCAPGAAAKPYMGIIGDSDQHLGNGPWEAATWTASPGMVQASVTAWDNDVVIGEFHQQQARTAMVCNATLDSQAFVHSGNVDTWTSCAGQLVLKRVLGAEHAVASINAQMGSASSLNVMNAVLAFVAGF